MFSVATLKSVATSVFYADAAVGGVTGYLTIIKRDNDFKRFEKHCPRCRILHFFLFNFSLLFSAQFKSIKIFLIFPVFQGISTQFCVNCTILTFEKS